MHNQFTTVEDLAFYLFVNTYGLDLDDAFTQARAAFVNQCPIPEVDSEIKWEVIHD